MVRTEECLALLAPSAYLELVAAGIAGVTVRLNGCDAPEVVERQLEEANRLLAACGRTDSVEVAHETLRAPRRVVHDLHALPVPRRALLFLGTADGRPPAVERPGSERDQMLGALRSLCCGPASRRSVASPGLAEIEAPSAILSILGCTGCGVCVRACPADALRLHTAHGTADASVQHLALRQMPAACLDCGECVRACPERAITTTGRHNWAELLAGMPQFLATRDARACSRCGGALVALDTDNGLCPVCAFRRLSPFGSMIPSGAHERPRAETDGSALDE